MFDRSSVTGISLRQRKWLEKPPPDTLTEMVMTQGSDGVRQRTQASWLSPSG